MGRLLSVIAVAIAAAALVAGTAGASNDVARYRVSYNDAGFGATTCMGVHTTGANGTATSGGSDVFFCTISRQHVPGTTYTEEDLDWCSDYFMQPEVLGDCVVATHLSITVVGTGRTIFGRADYS